MTDKIYVHMIEGTEAWVPIKSQQTDNYQYIIHEDKEYEDTNPSVFFEFYPGDIVEVDDSLEEEYQFKAVRLISFGSYPDRKYLYFMYKATLRRIPTSLETADEFKDEIKRVKDEISAGQFVYRGIKETIQYIDINLRG